MHQLELEIGQERNMADNLVSAMQPDLRDRYLQLKNQNMQFQVSEKYRVSHLLVDLGWVEFDLGITPYSQLLPSFHQLRQSLADSGTLENQVNPTLSTSRWDTL